MGSQNSSPKLRPLYSEGVFDSSSRSCRLEVVGRLRRNPEPSVGSPVPHCASGARRAQPFLLFLLFLPPRSRCYRARQQRRRPERATAFTWSVSSPWFQNPLEGRFQGPATSLGSGGHGRGSEALPSGRLLVRSPFQALREPQLAWPQSPPIGEPWECHQGRAGSSVGPSDLSGTLDVEPA